MKRPSTKDVVASDKPFHQRLQEIADKREKMQKEAMDDIIDGEIDSALRCPHCNKKGKVRAKVNLSGIQPRTKARCLNCESRWEF
jgi:transcription elongation factor Elf1